MQNSKLLPGVTSRTPRLRGEREGEGKKREREIFDVPFFEIRRRALASV